jgi:hypothetical protein
MKSRRTYNPKTVECGINDSVFANSVEESCSPFSSFFVYSIFALNKLLLILCVETSLAVLRALPSLKFPITFLENISESERLRATTEMKTSQASPFADEGLVRSETTWFSKPRGPSFVCLGKNRCFSLLPLTSLPLLTPLGSNESGGLIGSGRRTPEHPHPCSQRRQNFSSIFSTRIFICISEWSRMGRLPIDCYSDQESNRLD